MGPAAKLFLQSLARLVKNTKNIKLKDAYKSAQQEFGELTDVMKSKIDDIFKNSKAPSIKKPEKKSADIIPFPKKKEGIMSSEKASPMMKGIEDTVKMLQKNPKRPGGALDPATGLTRTAARQILQKLAKEGKINIPDEKEADAIIKGYQGGVDPLKVFRKTFGQDVLLDLNNLSEELIEIDRQGGSFKELNTVLDDAGFFNLKQSANPPQGMTKDELLSFIDEVDETKKVAPKMVERFELKQKYPGIEEDLLTNIIDDPDPQHKAEVLAQLDQVFEMMKQGKSPDEVVDILENLKNTRKDNAQGGLNYLMGL